MRRLKLVCFPPHSPLPRDFTFYVADPTSSILLQHPEAGTILDELRGSGWRKLIFRRWKIVYTIREDAIIIGRIWPAAMGEADLETAL